MSTWGKITTSAARGAVQRLNDRTLEYVTLLLRAGSIILLAFAVISVFAWIWNGGWRWGATLGASAVFGLGAGWLGFWHFGNREWFRGDQG